MNSKEKERLRRWAKELRKSLDLDKASIEIVSKIKKSDVYKSVKNVMSYMAKDIEISLNDLFLDNSKSWFLPVVEGEVCKPRLLVVQPRLLAVPYFPDKTKLTKNKFNILEPEIPEDNYFDQLEKKIKLDLIFVPGLCFDKSGNRLGFGAGFYDEFLKLNPDSFKIGCCPKECVLDSLPVDRWDIKVNMILTD